MRSMKAAQQRRPIPVVEVLRVDFRVLQRRQELQTALKGLSIALEAIQVASLSGQATGRGQPLGIRSGTHLRGGVHGLAVHPAYESAAPERVPRVKRRVLQRANPFV